MSQSTALPSVLHAEHVQLQTAAEVAMAEASTAILCIYMLLAAAAHYLLVYKRDPARKFLCCCVPRYVPRTHARNKPIDLFFPVFQIVIVLPLVQATCVWRKHQDEITTESTQLAWITVLIIGCISASISIMYKSRRTYFAHASTMLHLVPGFFFLYEGAVRHDASADIASACLLIICAVIQFVSPPKMLKDTVTSLYQERRDDHERGNGLFSTSRDPIFTIADDGQAQPLPSNRRQLASDILSEDSSDFEVVYDSDDGPRAQFDAYPQQQQKKKKYDPWAARKKVRDAMRGAARRTKRALSHKERENHRITQQVLDMLTEQERERLEQQNTADNDSDEIQIVRNYAVERSYNANSEPV